MVLHPSWSLLILSTVCAGLALFSAGCGSEKKPEPESAVRVAQTSAPAVPKGVVSLGPDAPELKQMTVEAIRAVMVPSDEFTAPAKITVNPNRVGHAVLPVPGRVLNVMVKLGDSVTRGQPVVAIESPAAAESETAYAQSEAGVRQAELAVNKADADLARLTDLFQHQAVAQKEVLSAQTTAGLSKASLEQARSSVQQARRRLELLGLKPGVFQQQIVVVAPVAGKVLEVAAVAGEFRNEINAPLITIADLSRVWATSDVPESKIRYCRIGGMAHLELIAYPNQLFHARVTRIADTVDSETRTIKVSAELDNTGGHLRPEMFGRLRYADDFVSMPWVPESAVVRIGERDYVFLEQSPGRFLSRPVQLGARHDAGFGVVSGLKPGDRVVTKGAVYLKDAL